MRISSYFSAVMVVMVFGASAQPRAEECTKITLHYHERPPYAITTEGGTSGITADPAATAFQKAGIPFEWALTPSKRQILIFQENNGCDCGIGWFKNSEREQYARFTAPIYKDKPLVAIARSNDRRIKDGSRIEDAFANRELSLLVKDGYSYGPELDEKIMKLAGNVKKTASENVNMIKMIKRQHADYFILAPEEAKSLIHALNFKLTDFRLITFVDMPEGNERHVMCSQKVGNDIIRKLDAAIHRPPAAK